MSDLRLNTIAGTVLGAGLAVLLLRQGGEILFHPHYPEKPAFAVEIESGGGGATAEAPVETGPPDFGTLFADPVQLAAFVEKGDKLHKQCTSCHSDKADGSGANTGPTLWNVFGRTAGTHASFAKYSDPMKAYAKPWAYENLYEYLESPAKYVKGTTMSFAGIRKSEDRLALVAYLRSINDNPNAALPAPKPAAAPAAATETTESAEAAPAAAPAPTEGAAPAPPAAPVEAPAPT